ncbi:type VI secretion system protein TssG [Desulfuromonas soudanensis]|uniref:Type VI secretion system protein TssG n=1 Tax=Desulfuromonas soudanensis TaxID=1603606 RepID=A0A0M4D3X0_9BACT|nr:type VI secretion system baseplate subunit TssG [Desulfuromonas soudanensis]ALC17971.1 type VI secretion system protein TssG [Desulfuromonas soudanensis]
METARRGELPALIAALVEEGPHYNFFQAVRLFEAAAAKVPRGPGELPSTIRFRPAAELSFPAGDIRRCRLDEEGRLEMQLNFMGFYGVDAPVPHYFLEAAAEEEGGALRAFLDIFNHRLYELLYLGWKKFLSPVLPGGESTFERYLSALSGVGGGAGNDLAQAFAGPLGSPVQNGAGLRGVLREFLDETPVEVVQFCPQWVSLPEIPPVGGRGGEELVLGENLVLGGSVLDVGRRVEIRIGPLPLDEALALLPGGEQSETVARLIRRYLPPTIDFDLLLRVRIEGTAPLQLGVEAMMLGWNSCLGENSRAESEIRLPGANLLARTPSI